MFLTCPCAPAVNRSLAKPCRVIFAWFVLGIVLTTAAWAKPKEVIVVSRYSKDFEFNRLVTGSGKALATKLSQEGQSVKIVTLGVAVDGAESDISQLSKLRGFLTQQGWGSGLNSIHFLGHGFYQGDGGLMFPTAGGGTIYVDLDQSQPAASGQPEQFGKARFARLLHDLLLPKGEIYLDHCWSGKPKGQSIGERIANETGRKVTGHTDIVEFDGVNPPSESAEDDVVDFDPKTPEVGYEGSVDLKNRRGKKIGKKYCWMVTLPLNVDMRDLHIELDPKPKKKSRFKKFQVLIGGEPVKGWGGSVSGSKKDGWFLSWFTGQGGSPLNGDDLVQVCVDFKDKKAEDLRTKDRKVVVTSNGGKEWQKSDLVGEGQTGVPEFISHRGDVSGDGVVQGDDLRLLEEEVHGECRPSPDSDGRVCANRFLYGPNADVNCDGCVDACDRDLLRAALRRGSDPPQCAPDNTESALANARQSATAISDVCTAYTELVRSLAKPGDVSREQTPYQQIDRVAATGIAIARAQRQAWEDRVGFLAASGYSLEAAPVTRAKKALASDIETCTAKLEEAADQARAVLCREHPHACPAAR